MKHSRCYNTPRRGQLGHGRSAWTAVYIMGLVHVALAVHAQAPMWWTERAVLDPGARANDFAPANQGQVKWLATQAAAELDAQLQGLGGAGTNVAALLATFTPSNNYQAVNVGQVKATAKPFYDRLAALSSREPYLTNALPAAAAGPYPWPTASTAAVNYAGANIGQVKFVFSINLDRDNDGLPDWWEWHYFTNLNQNASSSYRGDGWSNLQKYLLGLNPLEIFTASSAWITAPPDGAVVGGFE